MDTEEKLPCKCTMQELNEFLKQKTDRFVINKYALVTVDFDNFNFVNDLFGYDVGDKVLALLETNFSACLLEGELFVRVHADHFIFLLKTDRQEPLVKRLMTMMDTKGYLAELLPLHYNFVCSGGIVNIDREGEGLPALLDKANFARKKAKGNHTNTFLYYDKYMVDELEWRKIITLTMEAALRNHEFEMYLQPKILIQTNQVVGAEALVRWNSKGYGMIYPDRFIPILEQNGFVKQLDFFMLEQACLFLKESIAMGRKILPISVNFSRLHIRTVNFVEKVAAVVSRYGIAANLIEIELTENVFSEDFQALFDIASGLKYLGFTVSLDDFGRAYSSLNYLKDLPLDVIKIDKAFLNSPNNADKGKIIVTKVVELIKSLQLISVMEGVEEQEQVDFLQQLDCDMGQGFFYAKPMSVKDYVQFLQGEFLPEYLIAGDQKNGEEQLSINAFPQEFRMDNWELYALGKNIDMGLMKGYLDGTATVQYVNDRALGYLGYTRQEFREIFNNSINAFTHPNDHHILQKNAEQLIKTGESLAFQTQAIRKDGKVITLKGRSSCVRDNRGRLVGLYAFQDVTEELERMEAMQRSLEDQVAELELLVIAERESREALRLREECYRLIVEQSDDIMFEWDFETDTIYFSDKFNDLFGREAIQTNVTSNPKIRSRIHPKDHAVFHEWLDKTYRQSGRQEAEFRIENVSGDYIWVRSRSTAVCDESGAAVKAVGVFSDIHNQKVEIDTLKTKSQLDPLTQLYNKVEVHRRIDLFIQKNPHQMAVFFIIDIDNFKGVNDRLGHQFGDFVLQEVADKIKTIFRPRDIIGRIGGDEFVVFMPDVRAVEVAHHKADMLNQALRNSYFGADTKYEISGSIGVALYPEPAATYDELYRFADIALYQAKKLGKDCNVIYQRHMGDVVNVEQTRTESPELFLASYFAGDPIFNVFQMLYESKDLSDTIQLIMQLLGKRFDVDRVYIFQHSDDGIHTSNTHEWCAPGIVAEKSILQNLSLGDLSNFFSAYNTEGILNCNDISTMDPFTYEILDRQNIKSFLQCTICNEGTSVGFIGFDSCRKKRVWRGDEIAILGYISRVLSVFLLKKQISQELLEMYQNHVEMLGNLNGYVYVVDVETHELLYLNNATQSLGIQLGEKCYKEAFGICKPCERCPVRKLTDVTPYASEEIYSVHLDTWIISAASKLKWDGNRNAALICCTDISKYKRD